MNITEGATLVLSQDIDAMNDNDSTLNVTISEATLINLWSMVGLFVFVCGILLCCHWIQYKYEKTVEKAYLPTVHEDEPMP